MCPKSSLPSGAGRTIVKDLVIGEYFAIVLGNRYRVDTIPAIEYHHPAGFLMAWNVEYTNEFDEWWNGLTEDEQDRISKSIELLIERGPNLRFPHSSAVESSRHSKMRELRVQSGGSPIRIFYAFDPRRNAILLIGGDKTGNNRFYVEYVPVADRLYDDYLDELRQEGLIP